MLGFTLQKAGALGIIGGADGPTAIYTTIILAPHLLGPIAIAAYSYMALVPVIIPLIVRFTVSEEELKINMKQQEKLYPNKLQIKNLRTVKIIFPIILGTLVSLLFPSSVMNPKPLESLKNFTVPVLILKYIKLRSEGSLIN